MLPDLCKAEGESEKKVKKKEKRERERKKKKEKKEKKGGGRIVYIATPSIGCGAAKRRKDSIWASVSAPLSSPRAKFRTFFSVVFILSSFLLRSLPVPKVSSFQDSIILCSGPAVIGGWALRWWHLRCFPFEPAARAPLPTSSLSARLTLSGSSLSIGAEKPLSRTSRHGYLNR